MDYFELLNQKILESSPEEIFAFDVAPQWIWVNRDIFMDIVYNLGLEISDEEESSLFDHIDDEKVFCILNKRLKKFGYIRVNQYYFAKWEEGFTPSGDMETAIFIKSDQYNKMGLYFQRKYEWILKAMAIDSYFKMGANFNSLKECYEDNFLENFRIIEDLLSLNPFHFFAGSWEFISKDSTLLFMKEGQLMNVWTEGQAESFFNEMIIK